MNAELISVRGLEKRFSREAGFFAPLGQFVYAVNGVNFDLHRGETYALVGESGCGKTTTARLLVRMYEASAGSVIYTDEAGENARDVFAMNAKELKAYRAAVKYVFQDPAKSLDPRMTVEDILLAGYRYAERWPGRQCAREEAARILEETGLHADDLNRRPADFSGGQRQRISIARGLIMRPRVLICDEVVSALDVSVQGQILNLLLDLRESRGLSLLFITHDLKIACYFSDRIGVMYRGEIVEEAPAQYLYRDARHPYTQLLFASSAPAHEADIISGEVTSSSAAAAGCPFVSRCPRAAERCRAEHPPMTALSDTHRAACWNI
ncbi:MAG TPA: ABC transporter ATP-binding protein [Candidatus Treponema faecavium]|nr:ABC transporter ATP-binding protein [Candidatus Treponema faecavium]